MWISVKYLHAVNVNPTHAAAAVDEEDKLAVNLPQVWADGFELWTKIQHDHRVVEDVFMESPVNDIYLKIGVEKAKAGIRADLAPWDDWVVCGCTQVLI